MSFTSISKLGKEYLQELEQAIEAKKLNESSLRNDCISSGFSELDKLTGGFKNGTVTVLGSRPAVGKTTLAINILNNICIKNNKKALLFTNDISTQDILEKMMSSYLSIPLLSIKESTLNPNEFQEVLEFIQIPQTGNLAISIKPYMNIDYVLDIARDAKVYYKMDFIVIDYIQLLKYEDADRKLTKYHELSAIFSYIKMLARELNIPILCLSQLSRKVEERIDDTPILSDLKDCGSLEDDADVVLLLHRFDYKDKYCKPGLSKLLVAKNRTGITGSVDLNHDLSLCRFTE